jgi:diguanylate cyclase (GGDEF)-like protein/PAS domain S-box-containing protein
MRVELATSHTVPLWRQLLKAIGRDTPAVRLRLALHGTLATLGILLVASGWLAWSGEMQRLRDAELLNKVGMQRTLPQRLALLVSRHTEANDALIASEFRRYQDAATTIEAIFAEQRKRGEGLPESLEEAINGWRAAHDRFATSVGHFTRLREDTEVSRPGTRAQARVNAEADAALEAAAYLVQQTQAHVTSKTELAIDKLGLVITGGLAIMVALALFIVEPVASTVMRQRRRLEQRARQVQRLARVAKNTSNAVAILDDLKRIVWFNSAFQHLHGADGKKLRGLDYLSAIGLNVSDEATDVHERLAEAFARRVGMRVGPVASADVVGSVRWLDIDVQPTGEGAAAHELSSEGHASQGAANDSVAGDTGFIVVETDVTAVRAQEERFRSLLNAVPAGIIEQDAALDSIVDANPAAERILGVSVEDMRGKSNNAQSWQTVRDDLTPYPAEELPIKRSIRLGESVRGDIVGMATPEGRLRWLTVNSEPLRDSTGQVTGAVACFVDVTEQRTQNMLLSLSLQTAKISTWSWRLDTGAYTLDAEGVSELGLVAQEVPSTIDGFLARVHPDDFTDMEQALRTHFEVPQEPFRCEIRVRHADGTWRWAEISGAVVDRDANNRALRMVGVNVNITKRKEHEELLRENARRDSLTGLPNRSGVMEILREQVAQWDRDSDKPFAVLFLDFDRFKQVNDTLGHAAGDELLKQIAGRMERTLRPSDFVARASEAPGQIAGRLGGDEFVVLLSQLAHEDDACLVAERLVEALSAPYQIAGHQVYSTASIGIATSKRHFESADSLIRDADAAMYEAKRLGRSRWVMFAPNLLSHEASASSLESDLRLAIKRREIDVVYQPVVDLDESPRAAGRCTAIEALARWTHVTRGAIPPAEFIPLAEDSGLIVPLGELVLQRACEHFVELRAQLGAAAPDFVSVNLSVAQIRQPEVLAMVERCLHQSKLSATHLQLEITESLASEDSSVQSRLVDLRTLGVKLALDDFGTGYSSLSCLPRLPIHALKIDRSFVSESDHSEYHRALIEATLKVAQTLKISTVAEGIETIEQARLLQRMGCDRGQGYFYAKPMPHADLLKWLAARASESRVVHIVHAASGARRPVSA